MIKLLASKKVENITKYNSKDQTIFENYGLFQLKPHIMKYSYASKEYFLSVPWTYFVQREIWSSHNWSNNDKWLVNHRINFSCCYFSISGNNNATLFSAPLSNGYQGSLCFSGINNSYTYDAFEYENAFNKFLNDNNDNFFNMFNHTYSEFVNARGNNDYGFASRLEYFPVVYWLYKKINKSISGWPAFFKRWQQLGEIPLDFWPSSESEIMNFYREKYPTNNIINQQNLVTTTDKLMSTYDLKEQ